MHAAPPVTYPLGRARLAAVLLASAWLLGGATTLAWTLAAAGSFRPLLGWAAWLAAGLLALRGWRRTPRGQLGWDGTAWRWNDAAPGASPPLHAVLDLQSALLLHWPSGPAGARWLWVERAASPPDWAALRRAVYSPPRLSGPDGAAPPAA